MDENENIPTDNLELLKRLADELADLTGLKKKAEADLEAAKSGIQGVQKQMLVIMNNAEMQNFRTPRGLCFLHTTTRCSIADPDKGHIYLTNIGLGGLIKPTVNSNSLSADMRKLLEEGAVSITDLTEHGIAVNVDEQVRFKQ